MDEFSLIERIAARTAARADVLLGIGDDCALLAPPPGQVLAVTADTLNAGVHFPAETPAFDIGWKTLAVNLSDLAAMGAQPAWCTLAVSLPHSQAAWLDAFADGLFALADRAGITLVGGDTTRGPLSLSVTAMGWVPAGQALRRDLARAGDEVWVSGVPGEAALALRLWQQGQLDVASVQADADLEAVRLRLLQPAPRNALGLALRGIATAAIDISDGLSADLGHVCRRSGLAAHLQLADLPSSPALQQLAPGEAAWPLQTAGGDDYELCFCAPAAAHAQVLAAAAQAAVPVSCIGRLEAGHGVHWVDGKGAAWHPSRPGYTHFSGV
ncbi:thiamine-monophosphate kinase [Stenotrophomonas ginsengisoli]|uniref:Thiamine-monophosphate kinase n=1 Tax=Stenotrophomonas ginsengisoli TaxID=336566 RepID=A0A0R0DDI5_9GAMM|nr:thiamine-phosphate kinase [Stenotrophomonas ginsengisoli]KRG76030.1 thiamine-monophosphate kinase [Stenotrophomonas ginsengisoli]